MQAGSSKPWPDTLNEMTRSRKLDAQPLLDYFKPLESWLDEVIKNEQIVVGWNSTVDNFFPDPEEVTTTAPSLANSLNATGFIFLLTFLLKNI